MIMRSLLLLFLLSLCHCGVKGKPLPPLEPREIGIGRPQYKGLDQDLKKSEDEKKKREQQQ